MNSRTLTRWFMQTARTWEDIAPVVRETGIEFVDHDHKVMTEYALEINTMVDRMSKGNFDLECVKEQIEIFNKLYDYTEMHFSKEEAFIREYDLAGYGTQKDQHKKILASLRSMIQDFEAGKLTISLNLKLAIMEWVVNHINDTDYNTFYLENWRDVFAGAHAWEDVKAVVRKMDIEEIDREHRHMTDLIMHLNHFIEDMQDKEDASKKTEALLRLFDNLHEVTESHFKTEERFVEKFNIPNFQQHDKQHKKFLSLLSSYKNDFLQGKLAITSEFKTFILNWWIDHINSMDHDTFCGNPWIRSVMEKAKSWEDVREVIKKMGIGVVDEDHIKMTEMAIELNQLIDLFDESDGENIDSEIINKAFGDLRDFASEHFAREQEIIKEKNLPGFEKQCEQHSKFLGMLKNYRENALAGRLIVTSNLKAKILDWWINHINRIDYRTFVGK